MSIINRLLEKRFIAITGKGGIGKSTVAVALARHAAAQGSHVCLVESSARDRLARLCGAEVADQGGNTRVEVEKGLSCLNLDPQECIREYIVEYLGRRWLFDKVFNRGIVQALMKAMPGLAELVVLGRMYHMCEVAKERRWDLVLFDAPAFGHFLSMVQAPELVRQSPLSGPAVDDIELVRAFLGDRKKSGTLVVTTPEDLPVDEALDFIPRLLTDTAPPLLGVVINRLPKALSPADLKAVSELARSRRAGRHTAALLAERDVGAQAAALTLTNGLTGMSAKETIPVVRLPDLGAIPDPIPRELTARLLAEVE